MIPGMDLSALTAWMSGSPVAAFVKSSEWIWPGLEIFHFIGLALVVGVAGVFDARLLGFARQIPIGALNTLIPWAIAGIVINGITGLMFIFAEPTRYFGNPAFTWKVVFLTIAGLNVLVFNALVARRTLPIGAGGDAPAAAKVIAVVSLVSWFAVMYFGRMLPYLGDAF
jgi:hypothetical protein